MELGIIRKMIILANLVIQLVLSALVLIKQIVKLAKGSISYTHQRTNAPPLVLQEHLNLQIQVLILTQIYVKIVMSIVMNVKVQQQIV